METSGTVLEVKRQWWLKINTKPVRKHMFDGAIFPHVMKVGYTVDGRSYTKRKWISAYERPPMVGSSVTVIYPEGNPKRAQIL